MISEAETYLRRLLDQGDVSKDIVDAARLKLGAEVDLKAKVRSTDASKRKAAIESSKISVENAIFRHRDDVELQGDTTATSTTTTGPKQAFGARLQNELLNRTLYIARYHIWQPEMRGVVREGHSKFDHNLGYFKVFFVCAFGF